MLALGRRWQGASDPSRMRTTRARCKPGLHGDRSRSTTPRPRVREERFALPSPCRVSRVRSIGDDPYLDAGAAEQLTTLDTFAFASDGLHVALAPADGGFRRGIRVTACLGDRLVTFDTRGSNCLRWGAGAGGTITFPTLAECAIESGPGSSFVLRPLLGGEAVRLPSTGMRSCRRHCCFTSPSPSLRSSRRDAGPTRSSTAGGRAHGPSVAMSWRLRRDTARVPRDSAGAVTPGPLSRRAGREDVRTDVGVAQDGGQQLGPEHPVDRDAHLPATVAQGDVQLRSPDSHESSALESVDHCGPDVGGTSCQPPVGHRRKAARV